MAKRQYLLLYFVSLTFFGAFGLLQKTPGYMDAAYYYSVGKQMAVGKGFTEPFIWNYLASPTILPVPAFTYWMPLAGLLSAIGMVTFHSTTYLAARIPFLLLTSLIPLFNVYFVSLFSQKKFNLFLAAAAGLACGYYLPYMTITETFVPYFVLGGIFFVLVHKLSIQKQSHLKQMVWALLLGLTAGFMHLTRADGLLWLVGSWLFIGLFLDFHKVHIRKRLGLCGLSLLGYLVIMSPWYIRNLQQFKNFFPPGSNLAIYFTNYNDLFAYPVEQINLVHFLSSGSGQIILSRLNAGFANIESLIGIVCEILLLPFMIAGLWQLRKEKLIQFSLVMLTAVFLVMTFLFPFAGQRGGFFHSITALQCLFWGVTPIGFELLITKLAQIRKWQPDRSLHLLGGTLTIFLVILSFIFFFQKVFAKTTTQKFTWDERYKNFEMVEAILQRSGANLAQPVMVNDSPGYYASTGHSAIQMTSGSIDADIMAMKQFGAEYLLIDEDHPASLDSLYFRPSTSDRLEFFGKFDGFVIYKLTD